MMIISSAVIVPRDTLKLWERKTTFKQFLILTQHSILETWDIRSRDPGKTNVPWTIVFLFHSFVSSNA